MKADLQKIKRYLKTCQFTQIFNQELGWDNPLDAPYKIPYEGQEYTFIPIAQKRGFGIYLHTFQGRIPEERVLKHLDKDLSFKMASHLTIFVDANQENQVWLWVKQVPEDKKARSVARVHRYNRNQNGESLVQKIDRLFISLAEEDEITLTSVLDRVMQGFDVEKVTKTFYERFKKEHAYFLDHIEHITDEDDRKWYTSIMFNRLMFVYFLQKKKVLNNKSAVKFEGEEEYLEKRLEKVRKEYGPDNFYAFYRYFLRSLFHDGLNQPEPHSAELERVIGKVPHINGGIFDEHDLERKYQDIQIPDEVFERTFKFFGEFHWHLDDRPMRDDNEVNPDVLGYIFEKYINQKQMGAYYTKEDITDYISKNTIIPFIFEKVASLYPDQFSANGPIWSLLQEHSDEYIYDAMAHGVLEPLPPAIEAGRTDVIQRASWNQPAEERWALPTETWREVVERQQRYKEISSKIANGEISTINDLITYNLNITQFAQNVIAACEKPGLLRAFYDTITQVTVLDPTCGSGAFLFAALNILKPLYQACIERMDLLVKEQAKLPVAQRKEVDHIMAFTQIRENIDKHQNQEYFILKSITVNNLYGVDIMEEAIEICKLRLFLKLVAPVENPRQLEPLPDIDFNVLSGNTLIGFTSLDEVRRVVDTKLVNIDDTEQTLQLIVQDAQDIERDEQSFRNMQTRQRMELDAADIAAHKRQLRKKLERLREKLDPYLATEYGVYASKYSDKGGGIDYEQAFAEWKKSHKPFHWWATFHKIVHNGGFDVIIGNPPYVEYSKIKKIYEIKNYLTENCGNLYALSVERMELLSKKQGAVGAIIPVASISTDGYLTLQKLLTKTGILIVSNYDDRPSKLFDGLEHIRLSIILHYRTEGENNCIFTTKYNKWNREEREKLFNKLSYVETNKFVRDGSIPKLQNENDKSILQKVLTQKKKLSLYERKRSNYILYYSRKLSGFVQVLDHMPLVYDAQEQVRDPSELKSIAFETPTIRNVFLSLLNSSLFYWYLTIFSDCRHLNKREVYTVNFDIERASQKNLQELSDLSNQLMKDLNDHSKMLEMKYEKQGRLLIQCFYPKYSKPIIDEIDRILAQHYNFTPEELDFIINYDIKYRMGRDSGDESEE